MKRRGSWPKKLADDDGERPDPPSSSLSITRTGSLQMKLPEVKVRLSADRMQPSSHNMMSHLRPEWMQVKLPEVKLQHTEEPDRAPPRRGGGWLEVQLPDIRVDAISPLVRSFFKRVTAERWQLLRSGSPDNTTTSLLAELLTNINISLSNLFLAALHNTQLLLSQEQVEACVGDTVSETFAQVLAVQNQPSRGSVYLKGCMNRVISETVNFALRAELGKDCALLNPLISPEALKNMLQFGISMLKVMMINLCFFLNRTAVQKIMDQCRESPEAPNSERTQRSARAKRSSRGRKNTKP